MSLKIFLLAFKNIMKGMRKKTNRGKYSGRDNLIDNVALFISLGAQG